MQQYLPHLRSQFMNNIFQIEQIQTNRHLVGPSLSWIPLATGDKATNYSIYIELCLIVESIKFLILFIQHNR